MKQMVNNEQLLGFDGIVGKTVESVDLKEADESAHNWLEVVFTDGTGMNLLVGQFKIEENYRKKEIPFPEGHEWSEEMHEAPRNNPIFVLNVDESIYQVEWSMDRGGTWRLLNMAPGEEKYMDPKYAVAWSWF